MFNKEYLRHYREHIKLSVPVAISQFGHIMVGMVDTIMAGRLGELSLASATIATSVFIPFLMLGIGITYGPTSLIAKADGAGDREEIRSIFKHSLILNLVLSALLFVGLYNSEFVFRLLDQKKEIMDAAVPFTKWLAWSILPLMVFQTFKQFAEGLSFTRQAMVISISANLINVLLIFVFTRGWFDISPMGLNGIAIATLTARSLMAIAMVAVVLSDRSFYLYLKEFVKIPYQSEKIIVLIWISLPVGLQMVLESSAFGLAAILVGEIGDGIKEIAAHSIALNMAAFTYMGATGIAASATVKVGNELGRKDYRQMKIAGYSAIGLVLCYMSVTAILFVVLRDSLPQLYIDSPEVIRMASSLLLIAAFFQLSDGVQAVSFGALRGMGDVVMPAISVLVAYFVIGLPIGYWFAFSLNTGIEGIWYGLSLGLILVAAFLFLRFKIKSTRYEVQSTK